MSRELGGPELFSRNPSLTFLALIGRLPSKATILAVKPLGHIDGRRRAGNPGGGDLDRGRSVILG
jgi:hypothetical protein